VDFDRYSTSQEFLGLKSIVLDNHTQDPSMLAERVAMRFSNEMGIPAPRVVHARLFVNNAYVGLYTIVESIDKRFLKRVFDENDGFLFEFKYAAPYGFEYLGPTLEPYAEFFEPKTHELDSMFDLFDPIRELVKTANEAQDALFVPSTSRYLDLRDFVTYVAVENFMADNDGMVGAWGMNNFYLYRFEGKTLSRVLPWDKDSALQGVDYDVWTRVDSNVIMRRALEVPELRQAYLDALKRCAELAARPPDPVTPDGTGESPAEDAASGPGWLEREVAFVVNQIREAALEDDRKPFDNDRFEEEIAKKLEFARGRAAFVLRALDAGDR
jgi:hypothetical protein